MPSHHVIFLICRGKTQCPLIPLVKLTGAPGSCPVTISLCSNPQLGVSQREMAAHLEPQAPVLISCKLSKCWLVQLSLFNPDRSIRKLGNRV